MRARFWIPLLVIDLGLAWWLGLLWLDEDLDLKNVSWRKPSAIVPGNDSLTIYPVSSLQKDLSSLVATSERPLFWATRRAPPPPQPEKPVEAEPDPFSDVRVFGLVGSGADGVAILRTNGKLRRVKFGDLVGSWVFQGVEGISASFKMASGEVRVLNLVHAKQGEKAPDSVSEATSSAGSAAKFDDVIARRKAARAAAISAAKQGGRK